MGTTTHLDLPYPEGTDLVIGGDDAIQALADTLDTRLNPNTGFVVIGRANWATAVGTGPALVLFPGTVSGPVGFAYADGVLTRTGPARLFMVDVEVEVETGAGGGTTSASSTVELRFNGGAIVGSHDSVQLTTTELQVRRTTHRLATVARLADGDTLDVTASGSPNAVVGVVGLRVHPIGPAEA